jgi:hypothetical protein
VAEHMQPKVVRTDPHKPGSLEQEIANKVFRLPIIDPNGLECTGELLRAKLVNGSRLLQ